jgi:hypothetical protein
MTILGKSHCWSIAAAALLLLCEAFSGAGVFRTFPVGVTDGTHIAPVQR